MIDQVLGFTSAALDHDLLFEDWKATVLSSIRGDSNFYGVFEIFKNKSLPENVARDAVLAIAAGADPEKVLSMIKENVPNLIGKLKRMGHILHGECSCY